MTPYIPFRANASRKQGRVQPKASTLGHEVYRKLLLYFQLHRDAFDREYHKRSNVEAAFSAIKRKFGENLLSKNPLARMNELLAKLLAYNLTVLVHEIHEHGIDPASIGLPPPSKPRPVTPPPTREALLDELKVELRRLAEAPNGPCDFSADPVTQIKGAAGVSSD